MKRKNLLSFSFGIIAIILLNLAANQYFFRWDLTQEQRYSISPATKKLLENLEDEVYIKVYLEGQFPAGFKRLQKAIRETLEEFQIYAGSNVKFRFIDPSQGNNSEEKQKFYQELIAKGIPATNIFATEGDQKIEKVIFPGALIQYKGQEIPVLLFKTLSQQMQGAPSPDQILNQSIENVEYNLISAIRKISVRNEDRKNIGFLEGHGELKNIELADLLESLSETHNVFKVDLTKEKELAGLDAIVIAKPDTAFNEQDKYKIDQYIMNGGKAMFFLDAVGIYMDSVLRDKGSFSFPYNHNLTDMMFRYGVRLNGDMIKDLNAGFIPMVVGNMGNQQKIQPIPWHYYPLLNTFSEHPIVKNLDAVYTKFIGTIDTVKANGITKTPLLFTSRYSKIIKTPTFVTFNEARQEQKPEAYNQGPIPVAYLLEGKFTSLFKSRIAPSDKRFSTFKAESIPTKIIICSDGDILKNDIVIDKNTQKPIPMPLGYDRYSKITFSNKDFFINSLEYLLDEEGIISARRKEVALRPLDKVKLENERFQWQLFNMAVPVLLILVFGTVRYFIRKRVYEKA